MEHPLKNSLHANTISIPYSDLDFWLNTQYQISNFYGYFSSPHLNVMISVENSGVTEGYVTLPL